MTAPRAVSRDPLTGVQIRIGVMGSASDLADLLSSADHVVLTPRLQSDPH